MNRFAVHTSIVLLASAALPLLAQAAPDQAAAARTFADRQECAVKLTVTRKVRGKDQAFEVHAVSLDGKDLLVASLSSIESGGQGMSVHMMMAGGEEGSGKAASKGELIRVAMLRSDATEAEADLVLTDAALDLAFVRVRPTPSTSAPMPPAPPKSIAAPALLDTVLSIRRKGPDFQRAASAQLIQIAALASTPRTLYIPSQGLPGGTAVYTLAGELLGIATFVHNESVIIPVPAIDKLAAGIPATPAIP